MSAITTKIVEKYNLSPEMSVTDLSRYTSEFLENLTDDRRRNQARRRLREGFKFTSEQGSCRIAVIKPPKSLEEEIVREITKRILQNRYGFSGDQVEALFDLQSDLRRLSDQKNESKTVNIVISNQPSKGIKKESIGDMAQRFLRDKLSIRDVRAEAHALALSAKNANAGSSRLSRLRRELRNLNASLEIIEATKFPDITEDANKIQMDNRKKAETKRIDYPDEFTLESVKERLDAYNVKTLPDCQALADVMVMLCIRPAELTTLRITDVGVTGYAKNRGQPDIPRKFRSMEKGQERAKELLTWIQNTISSGRMGDPGKPGAKWFNRFLKDYNLVPKYLRKIGAVYGVVVHEAENIAHAYTIAGECLRHNPDNHTSPVQNYVVTDSESDPDEDQDEDSDAVSFKINFFLLALHEGKIPVKALINTSSKFNTISKKLFDSLGEEYGIGFVSVGAEKIYKDAIGEIKCLDLQFQYNGKWQSLDGTEVIDFQIRKNPSFDLVLGQDWLWVREAKISFEFSSKTCEHRAKIVIDGMSIPLTDEDFNKANSTKNNSPESDITLDELVDMFKKLSLRSKDNKQRKRYHSNISPVSPTPGRLNDDVSKNSGASKIKKYPKVDL
ncbi:9014_t:CDS:2, partial [Entrophospora sp. SA101]